MTAFTPEVTIAHTTPDDFFDVLALAQAVHGGAPSWTFEQLASHLALFPQGQMVALDDSDGRVVGMVASLILPAPALEPRTTWADVTAGGQFTTHDAAAGTGLYVADLMVAPDMRRQGIGGLLLTFQRDLAQRLGLARVRTGFRLTEALPGYSGWYAQGAAAGVDPALWRHPAAAFCRKQAGNLLALLTAADLPEGTAGPQWAVFDWVNPTAGQGWQARFGIGAPPVQPPLD